LNLKEHRGKAGLTLKEAAELIGISAPTVFRWENGINRVPADVIPRIKKAYGLTQKQVLQVLQLLDKEAS